MKEAPDPDRKNRSNNRILYDICATAMRLAEAVLKDIVPGERDPAVAMLSVDPSASQIYPRTTAPDFLERCRPSTAAFFRYWNAKRGTRAMPSRADIDPLEMKPWLAGTALIDVTHTPDRMTPYTLRYRLVGTQPTKLRGREVTGMSVEIGWFGADLCAALENYRLVIEQKAHVYDWDRTLSADGASREGETLLLPLSSDGETVNMVLVYQEVDAVL
jgi:hypothetical protein